MGLSKSWFNRLPFLLSQGCLYGLEDFLDDMFRRHAIEQRRHRGQLAAVLHASFVFRSCDSDAVRVYFPRGQGYYWRGDVVKLMERCEASEDYVSVWMEWENSRGIVLDQKIKMPRGSRWDPAFYGAVHPEEGDDVLEVGFNFSSDSNLFTQVC